MNHQKMENLFGEKWKFIPFLYTLYEKWCFKDIFVPLQPQTKANQCDCWEVA